MCNKDALLLRVSSSNAEAATTPLFTLSHIPHFRFYLVYNCFKTIVGKIGSEKKYRK